MTIPEDEFAIILARLREAVHGQDVPGATPLHVPARAAAERLAGVTPDIPFLYKHGRWGRIRGMLLVPIKVVLRKLMRWYVEPAFAQQRQFNVVVLQLVDELAARVEQLEQAARATAPEPQP